MVSPLNIKIIEGEIDRFAVGFVNQFIFLRHNIIEGDRELQRCCFPLKRLEQDGCHMLPVIAGKILRQKKMLAVAAQRPANEGG